MNERLRQDVQQRQAQLQEETSQIQREAMERVNNELRRMEEEFRRNGMEAPDLGGLLLPPPLPPQQPLQP